MDASETKMTAEEWHKLAAKALAVENEKIIINLVEQTNNNLKASEDRAEELYEKHLRDQFALAALEGLCSLDSYKITHGEYRHCYKIADIMMKARDKEV